MRERRRPWRGRETASRAPRGTATGRTGSGRERTTGRPERPSELGRGPRSASDRTLKRIEPLRTCAMCHHHTTDWTTKRAVDEDETEADDERPPAFEDERDVDVEILTDGGDE